MDRGGWLSACAKTLQPPVVASECWKTRGTAASPGVACRAFGPDASSAVPSMMESGAARMEVRHRTFQTGVSLRSRPGTVVACAIVATSQRDR